MYFHEIMFLMFLVTQVLLICIIWKSCQISSLHKTMDTLFFHGMDFDHEQYSVKHYDKHEIVLLKTCLLYIYFHPDWVGQYLDTYHNNVAHISSVVSLDV